MLLPCLVEVVDLFSRSDKLLALPLWVTHRFLHEGVQTVPMEVIVHDHVEVVGIAVSCKLLSSCEDATYRIKQLASFEQQKHCYSSPAPDRLRIVYLPATPASK